LLAEAAKLGWARTGWSEDLRGCHDQSSCLHQNRQERRVTIQLLGSINVDLIASVAALPKPGETILARSVARLAGGKGANQAVAAARMGAQVAMIGAVGEDDGGQWMLSELGRDGLDLSAVRILADEATGTAYIAVDAAGENQIIVSSGANARISAADLPGLAADTRIRLAQLETPIDATAAFFADNRVIRILNAAPALPDAARLLPNVDLLIVNQTELAAYLGLSDLPATVESALIARALISRAEQAIIVTLGAGGAVVVRPGSHFHAPAMPVNAIDTIGAGDCFVGSLAALLDEGFAVEQALPTANAAAALCTTTHGAVPAMPLRAAVEAAMAAAR
jgi:ribokinase